MKAVIYIFLVLALICYLAAYPDKAKKVWLGFIGIFKFSRYRSVFIVLFIGVLSLLFYDLMFEPPSLEDFRTTTYANTYSHYISFGTFLAALAAWFSTLYRDWKESLTKRLSVYFEHERTIVMQCNYAYLAGESDIRALAQQIGTQIAANDRNLDFTAPNIISRETDIIFSKEQLGCKGIEKELDFPFRHYVVLYHLNKIPKALKGKTESYIWNPPFNTSESNFEDNNNDEKAKDINPEESICKYSPPSYKPQAIKYNDKEAKMQSFFSREKFIESFWDQIKINNGYCTNQLLSKSDK